MAYFKVKVVVDKEHQTYTHICEWQAYAYYKTSWWKPWRNAGKIAEAEGPKGRNDTYGGIWKEEYLEELHEKAYLKAVIHYRSKLKTGAASGSPYVNVYDLDVVNAFVEGQFSEEKNK